MEKVVECDCGWSVRGSEADVIAATMRHAREVHDLDLTVDQVLAVAKPVVASGGGTRRSDDVDS